jgi:excinuclease ABC subunit A
MNEIIIHKAATHNLKNISLRIPKNKLIVVTGPSGSGKSSLAFDTIYIEGQRRYIESLSSYARQFIGQFEQPNVESIQGLSPSIAIDQKSSSKNPRSTVGTITEIYDYLRLLFARVGDLYCPTTGKPLEKYTPSSINKILSLNKEGAKFQITAPQFISDAKEFISIKKQLTTKGFTRVLYKKEMIEIEEIDSKKIKWPIEIDVVIDRISLKKDNESRLIDSIETAYKINENTIKIYTNDVAKNYNNKFISEDGTVYTDPEPRLFSFNSPVGACPNCNGLGESKIFDLKKIIADESLPLFEGAVVPLKKGNSFLVNMIECIAKEEKANIKLPYKKLPKNFLSTLTEGSDKPYKYSFISDNSKFTFTKPFPGLPKWLEKKYHETSSEKVKSDIESLMTISECKSCSGARLNPLALAVKINNKNISEIANLSIIRALEFFKSLELDKSKKFVADKILKEINSRLHFLNDVGLNYLNLSRQASTLSGGEFQRIRLATQIGSALTGVIYVLDEPSIGLHQRDNHRLIKTLHTLRDIGNTVIVVEHDEETMRQADLIIDMGPGAGIYGGEIVGFGTADELIKNNKSLTGKYLSHKESLFVKSQERAQESFLKITGAKKNNLKNITVEIPLNNLVLLTGVSGSGKSTFVHQILVPSLKSESNIYCTKVTGQEKIDSIIELDQSPIGRTPHSNPATYCGIFDDIRTLYSKTPDSQIRGYGPGRFSFNVKGGRCEDCEGNGVKKIEMHFLPDVYLTCSTCNGSRYNKETLKITYKNLNIADILDLSIESAYEVFKNHNKLGRTLKCLLDVGLGYLKLGQPATTLSGGEAQRMKISRELSKKPRGNILYVLDEPTTGLHFNDIKLLLNILQTLVNNGHSVLIIEHNIDVIKSADYVIDLGPEGGEQGGEVLFAGTVKNLQKEKKSHTAKYL